MPALLSPAGKGLLWRAAGVSLITMMAPRSPSLVAVRRPFQNGKVTLQLWWPDSALGQEQSKSSGAKGRDIGHSRGRLRTRNLAPLRHSRERI